MMEQDWFYLENKHSKCIMMNKIDIEFYFKTIKFQCINHIFIIPYSNDSKTFDALL